MGRRKRGAKRPRVRPRGWLDGPNLGLFVIADLLSRSPAWASWPTFFPHVGGISRIAFISSLEEITYFVAPFGSSKPGFLTIVFGRIQSSTLGGNNAPPSGMGTRTKVELAIKKKKTVQSRPGRVVRQIDTLALQVSSRGRERHGATFTRGERPTAPCLGPVAGRGWCWHSV